MSLLVVGSIGIDEVITPYGESGKVVGGSAIYFSWSASALCSPVQMVSVVGEDFPEKEFELLKAREVDIAGVEVVRGGKTFYWKGLYYEDMKDRDSLATDLNVLETFRPVLPDAYTKPQWVMLGNLGPHVQLSVLSQIRNTPTLVALDTMNFWMEVSLSELKEAISKVDLLFLNDSEALKLSGETSLKKAIEVIQGMGARYVCIKRGEHGAVLVDGKNVFICPALLLDKVVDPTGAGDCFAGGVLGYLAQQSQAPDFKTLQEAVVAGTAMASFCVEQFSTKAFTNLSQQQIADRMHLVGRQIAK